MASPSQPQPLVAAVAAGAVGRGPKPGSRLCTRVLHSSLREEDRLCLSPSGTNLNSTKISHASGGTSTQQIYPTTARALREVPLRDVRPSRTITTLHGGQDGPPAAVRAGEEESEVRDGNASPSFLSAASAAAGDSTSKGGCRVADSKYTHGAGQNGWRPRVPSGTET